MLSMASFSASAESCKDVFKATFALKPSAERFWLLPAQRDYQLKLPLTWVVNSQVMWLALDVRRVDPHTLEATFTRKGDVDIPPFKLAVAVSADNPRKFAQVVKDPATGDEWAIQLHPTCPEI